ncbi:MULTISPECIES: calcium-translocating P-type ATPase, PMCA-type [Blautia]|uniref:calcium-translocating P-type ATPase, PMCA-type n=1 Tax=Blautia TaxID=572511 RepID=UPI001D05E4F9|nr:MULTISPECIES: calcium-translocating P-type ATPase, PMCA-type [Blautia]MCB6731196.1 calcium-translocating P-type ATPase, PMCA-type [Blautia obeum]MCB6742215.1 calcium-translocating P-type ATPase, PMCA-type [Blautia sp. 210820-DFI.6.14]MCB6958643.1 calcium-translocating P-type ATPase, PMCA-type [Blautia obeum]MCG4675737.1 calcium-translocating P-type ATPase, PMCA-type [Blautia obeum]MDE8678502.1 calcium-translocating P-type ATPase, PMCA-type [Blautia schinkii]
MKDAFMMSREELLAKTGTDSAKGLNPEQVEKSRSTYGTNSFVRQSHESLAKRIWDASTEPMLVMLIFAAIITLAVNISRYFTGGEYNFLECVGIFAAIALSVVITIITEGKSAKAFEALNKINEDTLIKVIRNGEPQLITQKEIVVGDIIMIETGDKIVADGRLFSSNDLSVDESALTGESLPVKKDAEFVCQKSTPVAERANMLYSGCFVSAGNGQMLVTGVGNDTEFGQIAQELSSIEKTTTPLQEKLDKLGKQITVLGASAAAIVFAIEVLQFVMNGQLNLDTVSDAFITSIVLIVAAVPEGLPTIVAVSLALNIIKMSKENALVKKMIACETIGCVNIICSDKTGTLTENRMTVQKIYTGGELIDPEQLKDEMLLKNYCINSNANISEEDGSWSFIGNPTEGSLLAAAAKAGVDYQELRQAADIVRVFPFSSQNKDMSTIVRENGKEILYVKGNPEKIISLCTGISEEEKEKNFHLMEEFQNKAGRLLAFAHKELEGQYNDEEQDEVEQGLIYDGFVVISDPLGPDVYESIRNCRSAGIEVKMLTGDNIRTARAIANELHMLDDDHIAVEAADIEKLTDEELKEALKKIQVIARSTPLVKMRVVKLLKEQGNVVAVTGDGINDAPAIKHADVGISMGIAGTDVTKEASDMVLLDDSFSTIIKAVQWGRGIYENFKRFIQFQLTVNVSSVVVVICSILAGFSAPFTALELLWINIIMDGPPALTLGLEPIRPDLLKHKPTRRNENIISKKMLLRIFVNGIFISVIFMLQHFKNFLGAAPEEEATVLFTLFVLFQLFNAFNCRELDDTPMFKNLLKNKLMLGVFLLVLILQGIITQFGAAVFETVPLSAAMWGKMLLTAFTVIILNEGIKAVKRLFVRK